MNVLERLLHVLALATYLGSTLALVLVFLPATSVLDDDPAAQRRVLARGLRPYNVLSVGALGVLIMSGASSLTEWKQTLGPAYARVVWPLAGKLTLTFVLTMVGTWLSFGLSILILLVVAYCASLFATRINSAGSFYVWVARALGPGAGSAAGWGLVLGYLFTGVACVDWLADALLRLAQRPPLRGYWYDRDHRRRVWMPSVRLERLAKLAFDQIRQAAAAGTPTVLIRQLDAIPRLANRLPDRCRQVLSDQRMRFVRAQPLWPGWIAPI